MFMMATFVVVLGGSAAYERMGWDERTTAELEFDAWAQRQGRDVYSRACLDERTRGSDGRVPCAVVFSEVVECTGAMYCGAQRATVWCAGDSTLGTGCVWR